MEAASARQWQQILQQFGEIESGGFKMKRASDGEWKAWDQVDKYNRTLEIGAFQDDLDRYGFEEMARRGPQNSLIDPFAKDLDSAIRLAGDREVEAVLRNYAFMQELNKPAVGSPVSRPPVPPPPAPPPPEPPSPVRPSGLGSPRGFTLPVVPISPIESWFAQSAVPGAGHTYIQMRQFVNDANTVFNNTTHFTNPLARLYTVTGTAFGTQFIATNLSDAFAGHSAIDGHEQTLTEQRMKLTIASVQFGGAVFGGLGRGSSSTASSAASSGGWRSLLGGVRVKQTGNYWIKEVDPGASGLAQ